MSADNKHLIAVALSVYQLADGHWQGNDVTARAVRTSHAYVYESAPFALLCILSIVDISFYKFDLEFS